MVRAAAVSALLLGAFAVGVHGSRSQVEVGADGQPKPTDIQVGGATQVISGKASESNPATASTPATPTSAASTGASPAQTKVASAAPTPAASASVASSTPATAPASAPPSPSLASASAGGAAPSAAASNAPTSSVAEASKGAAVAAPVLGSAGSQSAPSAEAGKALAAAASQAGVSVPSKAVEAGFTAAAVNSAAAPVPAKTPPVPVSNTQVKAAPPAPAKPQAQLPTGLDSGLSSLSAPVSTGPPSGPSSNAQLSPNPAGLHRQKGPETQTKGKKPSSLIDLETLRPNPNARVEIKYCRTDVACGQTSQKVPVCPGISATKGVEYYSLLSDPHTEQCESPDYVAWTKGHDESGWGSQAPPQFFKGFQMYNIRVSMGIL